MKRAAVAVLAFLSATAVRAETFVIDPVHSSVNFSVRHMVGRVSGRFEKFEGTFDYAPGQPKSWRAQAVIQAASVNTGVEKRDDDLRSPKFLDAQKYPSLSFRSKGVKDASGETAKLSGELTIHGVTRPVVLELEIGGVVKDPWGNRRAGATAKTRINRKDYGLTWNQVIESGGLLVGEDVDIVLNIEGTVKK